MEPFVMPMLAAYGGQLPIILAYLVGIGVSLAFWGRYPRPARLAFLGCLALFLVVLVTTPVQVFLPWIIFQRDGNSSMVGIAVFGVGLVRSLLYVGGFGLLLAAAFAGRSQQAPVGHEAGRV